jgi:hypothetical protein
MIAEEYGHQENESQGDFAMLAYKGKKIELHITPNSIRPTSIAWKNR